jgi:SAM-dependent methyltransferase
VPREHAVFRLFSKIIYEINLIIFRYFYSNFEFHPQTKPLETNSALGVGNGHALSRDLHLIIPHLIALRILGCRSLLDLGSGDGFVLRLAEKLGFSKTFGIEAHPELFKLSEKNCPRSYLYKMYFEEISSDDFLMRFDVIYLFNPAEYETTLISCMKLNSKWILMKNFSFLHNDQLRLGLQKVFRCKSYGLYKRKSFS